MKKMNYQNLSSKLSLLLLAFVLAFSTNILAQEKGDAIAGEALYKSNCAACHKLDKKGVGPALRNVAEKYESCLLYTSPSPRD